MYNPGQELSSIDFGALIGGPLKAVVEAQAHSANTTVDFIRSVGFEPGVQAEDGRSTATGKPIYVTFKYPKEVAPFVPAAPESLQIAVDVSGAGYSEEGASKIELLYIGTESVDLKNSVIEFGANGEIRSVTVNEISPAIKAAFATNTAQSVSIKMKSGTEPSSNAKLTAHYRQASESTPAVYQDMQIEVPILTMMPIPYIKIQYADIELNVKINSVSNTSTSRESNSNVESRSSASGSAWFGRFKAQTSLNASYSNQSKSNASEEVKKDYSLNIKIHASECEMPAGMSRILDILEASIVNTPLIAPKTAS